jgi:multidrug efflux pump subunit AcrB
MNLAAFSINRNRITFTVLGTIMIMGMVFYQSLSRDSMPPYTVRVATVVASFPGSSPERVEQLVTDKVEKTVQEIPELKEVSSTSRSGLSVVTVELKDQVKPEDLQAVWDRLRRKLSQLKGLPSGVVPVLNDDGIGEVFGIAVGLVIDGFSNSEAKEYIDDIKDDLIKLDLASKVELSGVQDDRIFIEFDNARLKEYNLSASKLQSIISTTNILSSGGQVNLGNERIILEPTGNFNSLSDIKQTLIPVGNGSQLVYLGDITRITQDYIDPPKQLVKVNGQQAISMHISLKEGANIIQLGADIDVVLNKWQSILPVGLELNRLSSLDTYIDNKINAFVVNLLQSISIVLIVMLIFLGLRTGGIIASLIPMVTIMTIMLMGLINMGLNQVTLAALIMALGMMVDNAIVVAETIMVKMENGVEAKKAAIDACGELFTPLLISTLTTSAAFLAFYMAESTMGDIVGPIFIVITLALLSSWILALTVITLLCFMFLKVTPKAEKKQTAIDKSIYYLKLQYKNIILKALYYKNMVLLGIVVLFVLSLFGFGKIPFIFFPDSDRNMVTVDINLPQGSRIEATEKVIKDIETFISQSLLVNEERQNGISDWSSFIGSGPESYDLGYTTDEPDPSYAHILINTTNFIYNSGVVEKLDAFCFNNFPNADIKVGLLGSGGGGTPIEIKISGTNPDILAELSEQTKQKLKTIQGTKNIKDDWGPKTKKICSEY